MRKIGYPAVYASTFFLQVLAVFVVYIGMQTVPIISGLMLFWTIFYGIGLYCGWRYRENNSLIIRIISYCVLGLLIPLAYIAWDLLKWQTLCVMILMIIQAGRNFTLTNQRELYFAYVISLVLVAYGASIQTNVFPIVYCVVIYVFAGIYALITDYMDGVRSRSQGGDRHILQKMKLPVKGVGLTIITLLLSCGIYLVLPRLPSPEIRYFTDEQGWPKSTPKFEKNDSEEGTGEKNDAEADRKKSAMVMQKILEEMQNKLQKQGKDKVGDKGKEIEIYSGFKRRFDIMVPRPDSSETIFYLKSRYPVYARGKVFDTFDGRHWRRREEDGKSIYSQKGTFFMSDYLFLGTPQIYLITRDIPGVLFTAYKPVAIWFPGKFLEIDRDRSVASPGPLWSGTIYSVKSTVWDIAGGGRLAGGRELHEPMGRFFQVPDSLRWELKAMAEGITSWSNRKFDKALDIENYLRKNYKYVRYFNPGHDSVDRLRSFLFHTKKGGAEYFATSMTLLLRSIGIPARIVTGYRVTRYNPFTDVYEAQARDVHAWVEAHFDEFEYGWVTFEPTEKHDLISGRKMFFMFPYVVEHFNAKIESTMKEKEKTWWARLLHELYDLLKKAWLLLKNFWSELLMLSKTAWKWVITGGWIILASIPIAGIAGRMLYMTFLPYLKRFLLLRLKGRDPLRFIYKCYQEVERLFSAKGTVRAAQTSPEEYRFLLGEKFSDIKQNIDVIVLSFNNIRYGRTSINHEDAERVFLSYEQVFRFIRKI